MWAWYDKKKDDYHFVYKSKIQVAMCSPDGFKKATERGEGEITEVEVSHKKDKP